MEKKSRVNKYQNLRDNLSVEPENTVKSDQLYQYAEKMNKIQTPNNDFSFEKETDNNPQTPTFTTDDDYDFLNRIKKDNDLIDDLIKNNEEVIATKPVTPTVSRASRYQKLAQEVAEEEKAEEIAAAKQPEPVKAAEPVKQPEPVKPTVNQPEASISEVIADITKDDQPYTEPDFEIDQGTEEETVDNKDSFLEQTINEAKSYSMEKGERSAIDTTSAIIAELTESPKNVNPVKEEKEVETPDLDELLKSMPVKEEKTETEKQDNQLTDAQIEELLGGKKTEEKVTSNAEEAIRDDDLDRNFFVDEDAGKSEPEVKPEEETQQPQEVEPEPEVKAEPQPQPVEENGNSYADNVATINDLTQKLDKEHVLRADLEQQTKQMKMEMGELNTEVNTFSKKMTKTNMLLNFVLVILIIALFVVLAFIAYWALVDRGVIGGSSASNLTNGYNLLLILPGISI